MIRLFLTSGIMVGCAVAFLVRFILIATRNEVLIREPNAIILLLEIVGMLAIIGFGLYNMTLPWRHD